jgi:uncharacterized protein
LQKHSGSPVGQSLTITHIIRALELLTGKWAEKGRRRIMTLNQSTGKNKRVAIREDLFTTPLDDLSAVHMKGSKCMDCGEVFMGCAMSCAHCGRENMKDIVLNDQGFLYTYSVIEYPPPGDYKGSKDPFVPFVEGLVELPDGIRIVAPVLECDPKDARINMPLKLKVYDFFKDEEGNDVVAFCYVPA